MDDQRIFHELNAIKNSLHGIHATLHELVRGQKFRAGLNPDAPTPNHAVKK